jgi:hypothetical protein
MRESLDTLDAKYNGRMKGREDIVLANILLIIILILYIFNSSIIRYSH